jgi:hypothetical protein
VKGERGKGKGEPREPDSAANYSNFHPATADALAFFTLSPFTFHDFRGFPYGHRTSRPAHQDPLQRTGAPQPALLREGHAGDNGRRVRRALPGAAAAGAGLPGVGAAGLADQAGGRAAAGQVFPGAPLDAHALPGKRLQRAGYQGLRRPGQALPGAPRNDTGLLQLRAEDGRRGGRTGLPAGALQHRLHPRRRPGGRGGHRKSEDHQGDTPAPAPGRSAGAPDRARRGLPPAGPLSQIQQGARGGRPAGLRQPQERRGGIPAPARLAHHGQAPLKHLLLCPGRDPRRQLRLAKRFPFPNPHLGPAGQ